ncbi:hypothetical protein AALO_G00062020 [Alosa alosa]|uniref:Reverse transcriptase domain-containing protein n=1 Tax=Alosa alosa TaxID=278164 RepID=A0AAV6H3L8_9TELE|nr:hypothetical protein AALO_G00062020 [Alosa alosa]
MNDIIAKDYAVKVHNNELSRKDGKVWYLPHHGVYHPQKLKIRVVFDCGVPYQGTSLNVQLLQGPDLTSSLFGVITRFRQEQLAIMADVEAMFYQVKVPEDDADLLRFLWWPSGDRSKDNKVHCAFVMAKARVAPLKLITIPCMELVAATMAARMDKTLRSELQLQLEESVFWSNSTTVLKYIANRNSRFRTFMANRVETILKLSKTVEDDLQKELLDKEERRRRAIYERQTRMAQKPEAGFGVPLRFKYPSGCIRTRRFQLSDSSRFCLTLLEGMRTPLNTFMYKTPCR